MVAQLTEESGLQVKTGKLSEESGLQGTEQTPGGKMASQELGIGIPGPVAAIFLGLGSTCVCVDVGASIHRT